MALSRQQRCFNFIARYVQKPGLRYIAYAPALRRITDWQGRLMHRPLPGVRETHILLAPGLTARRMAPKRAGPRRLLFLHGGGFINGSSLYCRWLAARLAAAMGGVAVLPNYRLAPEHPFPAALEDAVSAYRAMLETTHPEALAVAGDSAGGGLTLSLLARLRSEGLPFPGALGLLSPFADASQSLPSIQEFRQTDLILPEAFGHRALHAYLGDWPRDDPEVSPLFANLTDAPPALIQVSDCEVLRDEAVQVSQKMPRATLDLWSGLPHVWQINAGWSPEADRAVAKMGAFFDQTLSR